MIDSRSRMTDISRAHGKISVGDSIPPKCSVIEVLVGELKQLFNAIDPSPFRDKDLDPEAEEFIVEARLSDRLAAMPVRRYMNATRTDAWRQNRREVSPEGELTPEAQQGILNQAR